ncbi:MAG TPA: radical SAM protein [Acidobacteriota bacterium]|nr:radical SAM protein [Acidobacteriota bacterium]HQM62415.1 radical SAM protein [Acidobacteriota bacterium]
MRSNREWTIFQRKQADDCLVGVVYPAAYAVGMSNLGFQWVLRQLDITPGFFGERFFHTPGAAAPRSLEGRRRPGDCHLLAFSVSFETDYLAVLQFLAAAGLPLQSAQRDRRHPLVVAGGAALQVNPEPLALFVDLVVVGEAEAAWAELLAVYRDTADRQELLVRLAGRPGFYVPSWWEIRYGDDGAIVQQERTADAPAGAEPVVRLPVLTADDLAALEPPFTNLLSTGTEFARTLLVEVARGCPTGCRYCWAGYRYRPVRPFAESRILAIADAARGHTDKIGLVSTAVGQYPDLARLMADLHRRGFHLGLSSMRLADLTPELLRILAEGGEDTLTLAPETGADSMRARLNKPFTNEQLLDGCRTARAAGIRRVRLYFMAGLPGEEPADADAAAALAEAAGRALTGRTGDGRLPVTVSLSPFVPKPNTPFQYAAMPPLPELRATLRRYAAAFRRRGIDAQIGSAREAHLQWRLATGSRVTGQQLVAVAEGTADPADLIAEHSAVAARPFVATPGRRPPWAMTTWGLSENHILEEWRRFRSGDLTPPCPSLAGCTRCGICGSTDPSPDAPPSRPDDPESTR